jgi:hypothetical protein
MHAKITRCVTVNLRATGFMAIAGEGTLGPAYPLPPRGTPPPPPAATLIKHPLPQWGTPPPPWRDYIWGVLPADGMYRDPLIRSPVVEIWPLCCNQINLGYMYILGSNSYSQARQLGTGMSPAGCCEQLKNINSNLI